MLLLTNLYQKYFRKNILKRPAVGLDEISSRMDAFVESFPSIATKVEPAFIALGEQLQIVQSETTALSQQIRNTVSLIYGKADQGVLEQVKELTRQALEELDRQQNEVTTNIDHIFMVAEHLGGLQKICLVLDRIAIYLRIVGLNIGIESTRSAQAGTMFNVIAPEIQTLSQKIIKISTTISKDAKKVRDIQIQIHSKSTQGLEELSGLAGQAKATVNHAVNNIENLVDLALQALDRASQNSKLISDQIGEIVVGLQFHDNMRQRIETITTNIKEAISLVTAAQSLHDHTRKEKLTFSHSILALQTNQLKDMVTEVINIHHKIFQAFDELRLEVDNLTDSMMVFEGGKAGGDPFEPLKTALKHLHLLITRGHDLAGGIRETAEQAAQTAVRLDDHKIQVEDINFETRLKALNAIINAAHLGESGRPLEVLAHEMKRVADQSNQNVTGVTNILEAITAAVEGMQLQTLQGTVQAVSGGDLTAGIEAITSAYRLFDQDSFQTSTRTEELKTIITKTHDSLSFFDDLSGILSSKLQELEQISDLLSPLAVADAKMSQDQIDTLLLQNKNEQSIAVEIKPSNKEDFGDNVELF